jgi:superfamily II DNA/RNA helicase
MYLDDIATLEWEVLRWRRLKSSIIGMVRAKTLKDFLTKNLSDDHYRKKFEEALVKILQENLEEGQTREDAQGLARHCAKNSSDAVEAVNDILTRANLHIDELRGEARAEQAEEIVQDFLRHVPSAVRSVDRLLAEAAVSIDDLIVEDSASKSIH